MKIPIGLTHIKPLEKANTGTIADPIFKPRFIALTTTNLRTNYGMNLVQTDETFQKLQATPLKDQIARTPNEVVKRHINKLSEQYGIKFNV